MFMDKEEPWDEETKENSWHLREDCGYGVGDKDKY